MVSESLDGLTGNLSLLTDHDHVELETTLQELVLNLLRDGVETDIGRGADFFSHGIVSRSRRDCAGGAVAEIEMDLGWKPLGG